MIPAISPQALASHAVSGADVGARAAPARASAASVAALVIETATSELAGAASAKASTAKKKATTTNKSSSAGYAKTTTAAKKTADPLGFLKDPNLSIEQKLMQLLAHLNAKYEAEMQEKMDVLAGKAEPKSKSSSSTSGTSKPKKGLLSSIVEGVDKFFPAVGIAASLLKTKSVQTLLGKLGGPVLAAAASAMGFPALAPTLLKLGPAIVNVAVDAAKALDGGAKSSASGSSAAASKSSSSSSSSSSSTAKKELSDGERQLQMMELQRIQNAQKEAFQLVSNILKVNHDMRFAIIGNIR